MKKESYNAVGEMDRQTTTNLKGLLAVMVLISHLHGRVDLFDSSVLGTMFSAFGYLAVSGFLFLSGYGLRKSLSRNAHYTEQMPKKKIIPFYCICILAILVYLLRDIVFGKTIYLWDVVQSFFFGGTIVDNGWYLQAQLLFYFAFYFSYKCGEKKGKYRLLTSVVLYCLICVVLGLTSTWYEASFCFVIGVLVAECEKKGKTASQNGMKYYLILVAAFLVTLYFGNKAFFPPMIRIIIKMISSILFTLLMLLTVSVMKFNNGITEYLGEISLEIYILQGVFLNLFIEIIPITNEWFYLIAVTASTVVSAVVLHPLFRKVSCLGR